MQSQTNSKFHLKHESKGCKKLEFHQFCVTLRVVTAIFSLVCDFWAPHDRHFPDFFSRFFDGKISTQFFFFFFFCVFEILTIAFLEQKHTVLFMIKELTSTYFLLNCEVLVLAFFLQSFYLYQITHLFVFSRLYNTLSVFGTALTNLSFLKKKKILYAFFPLRH